MLRVCALAFLASASLSVAETAGLTTPGTTNYPNGGMNWVDEWGDSDFTCSAIDVPGRAAYFGMNERWGRIVKVDLQTFKRVGAIVLSPAEGGPVFAALDSAAQVGYFGSDRIGRLIRIDLANLARTGNLDFSDAIGIDENEIRCGVIDVAAGFGYFGQENKIRQVDLATFTHVGTLELPGSGETVRSAAIDAPSGFAYFSNSKTIVKVRLSDFSVAATLPLSPSFAPLGAEIDLSRKEAYFAGGLDSAQTIARIDLTDFSQSGTLILPAGTISRGQMALDTAGGRLFATEWNIDLQAGFIRKIDLGSFTLAASGAVGFIHLPLYDSQAGFLYGSGRPVTRFDPADLSPKANLELNYFGNYSVGSAARDAERGALYLAPMTYGGAGWLTKLDLATFTPKGSLDFQPNETQPTCVLMDAARDTALIGLDTSPGRVVRVDAENFVRTGGIAFPTGESGVKLSLLDEIGGAALFGTASGHLVRVDLATFARTGSLPIGAGGGVAAGCIDPAGRRAFFAVGNNSLTLTQVDLDSMAIVKSATLPPQALDEGPRTLFYDEPTSAIYAAPRGYYAHRVVRIDPGTLAPTGMIDWNPEGFGYGISPGLMTADPAGRALYVGGQSEHGVARRFQIRKINLDAFQLVGKTDFLKLDNLEPELTSIIFEPGEPSVQVGIAGISRWVKIGLNQGLKGRIKATKISLATGANVSDIRFYSHQAGGNVRLAIYADDATPTDLVWESSVIPNTVTAGEIVVPISAGKPPALTLGPGNYALAFQVDTTASVASYTPGAEDEGYDSPQPFGPAVNPPYYSSGDFLPTSERWTEYITYTALTPTPSPSISPTVSKTPTKTVSPTISLTPTPSPTPSPSISPSPSPTPSLPVFVIQPESQSVNVETVACFRALAESTGEITYEWRRDGSPLLLSDENTLKFIYVQPSDAGVIRCIASVAGGGMTQSNPVTLTVHDPPLLNSARYLGTTAPVRMEPGQLLHIGITMLNDSPLTWFAQHDHALSIFDDSDSLFAGADRLGLTDELSNVHANGGVTQFIGQIVAPQALGSHTARAQMYDPWFGLFGEIAAIQIEVVPPRNAALDWAAYE